MARTVGSTATETRRRVLEAALEVFAERGYAGATLRDIAERLAMTKAALYYHFPAKDDLLRALAEPVVAELAACVRDAGHVPPRALLRRLVDVFDDNRRLLRGVLSDPAARQILVGEHDMFAGFRTLERTLAPPDAEDGLLSAQCALGVIRGAVLPTGELDSLALSIPPVDPPGPLLSAAGREIVTAAALAALHSGGGVDESAAFRPATGRRRPR